MHSMASDLMVAEVEGEEEDGSVAMLSFCRRANAIVACTGRHHWTANAGLALLVRFGVEWEASLLGLWEWLTDGWLHLHPSTAAAHLLALALSVRDHALTCVPFNVLGAVIS